MSEPSAYMIIYRPPRSDFWTTLTEDEKTTVEAHFYWLQELYDQGIVKFAGRSDDATFGVAIVVAESMEDAERIMKASPAYTSGMYSGEVRPHRLG